MKFFSHSSITACKQPTIINEVDTGAAISSIHKELTRIFSQKPLESEILLLKTYTGEQIPVWEKMKVRVFYLQQSQDLWLEAVSGKGPSLMGCNWMEKIKLNTADINTVRIRERHWKL